MKSFLRISPILLCAATNSYGAGYQLQERSTSGQGRAFAGEAAIADDAAAIATNPASLMLLDGTQLSSGFTYVAPDVEIKGQIGPFSATDSGPAQPALIPYTHASHRVSDNFAAGLSIHSRFGLSTDYSDSFLGSSMANKSEIRTFYLSPKVAYQVNSKWSLGAGLDIIYTDGELSNSIPSGAEIANVTGYDWAHGFNLGAVYQATENTRFGLAYHSEVALKLEGEVTSQTGIPFILAPNGEVDGQVQSDLPASLELSLYHQLNDKWTLHSSVTWTGWSAFDELTVETDNGNLPTVEENWKDTYRVAAGASYKHSNKWTFRAGAAFDESPVRSSEFRTLRIPDSDRYWLSAGATYTINEKYSIDCAYSHIFAKKVSITDSFAGTTFNGETSASVSLIALSLNGTF